ncbi:amphi-Trp domain-containing protein [Natronomonas sp. EA1]|uniref:amphi-Trp domain-containing protein n=1 Tax=Natronomonas sp. EA1 TaxID=3421655 RepID=UPI003EB6F6C6
MEETLFKTESRQSRADVAALLRSVADKLEVGESITLSAGDQTVTLDVPANPTFEVKAEREVEGSETELSVEFELEWDENGDGDDGDLDIS